MCQVLQMLTAVAAKRIRVQQTCLDGERLLVTTEEKRVPMDSGNP
jgi:hypothetical protein